MSKNLAALVRYKTIDACLQNTHRRYTLLDLAEACGEALYEHLCIDTIPSERTIYKDLHIMKSGALGYEAPIVNHPLHPPEYRNGERITSYYVYDDPMFSIYKLRISSNKMCLLQQVIPITSQFHEFAFLQEAEAVISELHENTGKPLQKNIIGFEKISNASGLRWLNSFYVAIRDQRVLRITYQPFQKNRGTQYELHPYFLKEYNNRWFLFGLSVKKAYSNRIVNLGLDRVLDMTCLDKAFIRNISFNPEEHFRDIIGVTRPRGAKPERVVLTFHPIRGKYVLTKPLHESQKLLVNNSREIRVALFLIINRELEAEILGYKDKVKVLQPVSLQKRMRMLLEDMKAQYC